MLRTSPRIVKVLLAEQFFEGFVPITALYSIMFERVGNLSFEQIGLLFSIWYVVYTLAELPSGVLADYWSRRNVIILGGLLRAAGFAVWLVWPTFTGYAIGFALWGIMIACTSGAVAAYLHNEVESDRYAKYFGWINSAFYMGALLGFGTAALLTLKHSGLLICMSLAASLLFGAVLAFTPEKPYKRQTSYLKTMAAGFREITGNKKLRYVSFGLFSIFMIIGVIEDLLPRIYAGFGLNDSVVSIALAVSLVLTVTLLVRLESLVHFSMAKQMLGMALATVLFLAGLRLGGISGSLLVLVFSLVFHLFRPLFQHHVQAVAQGDERATIGSIPGMAAGLCGAAAFALMGKGAEISSELTSIGTYGALWLVILLVLAYAGRKYHIRKAEEHHGDEPVS